MRNDQNERVEDYLKQFRIQYSGLAFGQHDFSFEINNTFFKKFDQTDVTEGSVRVDISLDRQETIMIIDFAFDGFVEAICDRCADDFKLIVKGKEQLVVKFHHESEVKEEGDVVFLPYKDYEIDLSHYIYEFISLLIPFRKVHIEVSDCNQETIKQIENLNNKKTSDPRWDALKDLLNN